MTSDLDTKMLRINGRTNFIRWVHGRNGWFPEVMTGRYLGHTPDGLAVNVDGETRYIDESVWAVYRK